MRLELLLKSDRYNAFETFSLYLRALLSFFFLIMRSCYFQMTHTHTHFSAFYTVASIVFFEINRCCFSKYSLRTLLVLMLLLLLLLPIAFIAAVQAPSLMKARNLSATTAVSPHLLRGFPDVFEPSVV